MLGLCAIEQLSVEHLFGYSSVVKANNMAFLVKPGVINVHFNADCIELLEDYNVGCVSYPVDAKNRS